MEHRPIQEHHANHVHAPPHAKPRRIRGRFRRLIMWEWVIVLTLLGGLAATLLVVSRPPDPKRLADALVAQMAAAVQGRPMGDSLFGSYPIIAGGGRELMVTIRNVPPKVCVLASWDLYRTGTITVNNVTPQRVSAAKLVELCNSEETATIIWSPKTGN